MKKLELNIQYFAVDAGVEFNFDISKLKKELQVMKSQVTQNQQLWNSYAAANENWEQTASGVEQRLDSLNDLMDKQRAIIKNLEEQQAKWKTKLDEGNPSLAKMAAEISKAKAKLAETTAEYDKQSSKLIKVGDGYKTLDEILGDFNRDIDIANAQYKKAIVGIDDWTRSTTGLQAKLTQLNTVTDSQRKKVDVLETEYQKLLNAKKDQTTEGKKLYAQLLKEQTVLEKNVKDLEEYSSETYKTRVRVNELKDEVEKLTKDYKQLENQEGKNKAGLKELRSAIDKAISEYQELERQLGDIEEANEDVDASNETVGDGYTTLKDIVSDLVSDAFRKLVSGLRDIAVEAINTGITFESSFASIVKTVNATEDELDRLKDSLMDLSTRVATPLQEINEIAAIAGQLNIPVENIDEFTETMIKLGDATDISAEQSALELARLASIMGTSPDKYENMGSSLVELGNTMATTESEILTMAMRLAGAGKQVGLSESEVLALAASFSSVGINEICPAY